jgi:hypothetical protein
VTSQCPTRTRSNPVSPHRSLTFLTLVALCAPLSFIGCAQQSKEAQSLVTEAYPTPGTMKLVSIDPVPLTPAPNNNLIENGSISDWWAGSPAPDGWSPPRTSYSAVTRERSSLTEGFRARQIWHRSDIDAPIDRILHCKANRIEPGAQYRLTLTGAEVFPGRIVINVWEYSEEAWKVRLKDFIVVETTDTGIFRYTRDFTAGAENQIALSSQCEVPEGKKAIFDWHDWSLVKLSDDDTFNSEQSVRPIESGGPPANASEPPK